MSHNMLIKNLNNYLGAIRLISDPVDQKNNKK